MNFGAGVVVFVIIWWCVFLAVLPIGVKGDWESDAPIVPGAEPGAPNNPDLKRKALQATIISSVLSVIVIGVIVSGIFDYRD
ncbi:MAG: DUF1467 family protein [Pseudomonadota bacterium]